MHHDIFAIASSLDEDRISRLGVVNGRLNFSIHAGSVRVDDEGSAMRFGRENRAGKEETGRKHGRGKQPSHRKAGVPTKPAVSIIALKAFRHALRINPGLDDVEQAIRALESALGEEGKRDDKK